MRTITRTALATTAMAGLLATAGATGIAHAAPSDTTQQSFQLHYNSSVSDQVSQVIGHGPISGVGTDVETVVGDGGQAVFTFESGSLVVDLHIASETPTFDLTACHASVALAGSWHIDHGTGAYAAATGDGTYGGTREIFGARVKGVCQGPDSGVQPRMVRENVQLTGTTSLG